MTQDELDALPEMGQSEMVACIVDGQRMHMQTRYLLRALWTAEDEPAMVCDVQGKWWRVGWAYGQEWKVRSR